MNCIKCKKEIPDGSAFCQYCGTAQNAMGSFASALKDLEAFPMILKSFDQVVKLIKEKNYGFAANAMRQTVEGMVGFIFSSCKNADAKLPLNDKIELLYSNNLITTLSYNNYTKIRYFGNQYSHVSNNSATSAECENYFDLLGMEIVTFVNTYAKVNYANIVIKKPLDKEQRMVNLFQDIFARIFGCGFAGFGGFFIYMGIREDMIPMSIFGSVFLLVGLSHIIGGAKLAKFLKKVNRRF